MNLHLKFCVAVFEFENSERSHLYFNLKISAAVIIFEDSRWPYLNL